MSDEAISLLSIGGAESKRKSAWRVQPDAAGARSGRKTSWFAALWPRREPTLFQRCLAVHIHYAGPRSGLS